MPNVKVFLLLTIVVCQVSAGISANIERRGRRVQIDGFLLEWNRLDARKWDDSLWTWDAINTAEGAAGYITAQNARACSSWTFTISADNKNFEIKIPEQTAANLFAFDKGSFENEGIYTIEWLVPWDITGNENAVTLNAANACGDTLETLRLSFVQENPPSGPKNNYIIIVSAVIAIIVAACIFTYKKIKR
jgi:hypothetical protein